MTWLHFHWSLLRQHLQDAALIAAGQGKEKSHHWEVCLRKTLPIKHLPSPSESTSDASEIIPSACSEIFRFSSILPPLGKEEQTGRGKKNKANEFHIFLVYIQEKYWMQNTEKNMVWCNHSSVIKTGLLFNYTSEAHFLSANRSISLHKIWSYLLHYPAKGPKMNVVYLWGCRLLITAIAVLVTADQLSGSSLPITLWASTSLSHGTAAPEQLTGGGTTSQSRVLRWTQLTHWQEQALYCSWFTFLKCWEQLHESQIFIYLFIFNCCNENVLPFWEAFWSSSQLLVLLEVPSSAFSALNSIPKFTVRNP